ncbi:MAG: hypothetical protein ACI9G9_000299 [Psychromonas sp.]|jgi:hypothetical protein
MDDKNTDFPQYRKLSNGLRFYEVLSYDEFDELSIMGDKVTLFKVKANQYPEKLRILDMLNDNKVYNVIDYKQYELIKTKI